MIAKQTNKREQVLSLVLESLQDELGLDLNLDH